MSAPAEHDADLCWRRLTAAIEEIDAPRVGRHIVLRAEVTEADRYREHDRLSRYRPRFVRVMASPSEVNAL